LLDFYADFKGSKKIICLGGERPCPEFVLSELKKTKHKIAVISAVLTQGAQLESLEKIIILFLLETSEDHF
jgi:hypothetical protein